MSWTLLESQTLSGSQASITLGSGGTLNQGYKTLKIVWSARTDRVAVVEAVNLTSNGSPTYSNRYLNGDGAATASGSQAAANVGVADASNATANTFSNGEIYIPNYTLTTGKPISADSISENNAGGSTSAYQQFNATLVATSSAINTITLTPNAGGNFVSGTTVTLYGLK